MSEPPKVLAGAPIAAPILAAGPAVETDAGLREGGLAITSAGGAAVMLLRLAEVKARCFDTMDCAELRTEGFFHPLLPVFSEKALSEKVLP
jgi:hypothetical protein